MTPEVIARIQQALELSGHDPSPVNKELNVTTQETVGNYQKKNGLETVGISIETLDKLGVER